MLMSIETMGWWCSEKKKVSGGGCRRKNKRKERDELGQGLVEVETKKGLYRNGTQMLEIRVPPIWDALKAHYSKYSNFSYYY